MRIRRTRITGEIIESTPRWANPSVTFTDWHKNDKVEVILTLSDPWAVAYLRRELDKITAYWKEKAAL